MKKKLFLLPFLSLCILMTSCEKQDLDLPVFEVESTIECVAKFVRKIDANQTANHVYQYINACQDLNFVGLLEGTNRSMSHNGFDYLGESKVYTMDNVLFYPVLRNSERNSGFLNMCIPFYRFDDTEKRITLLEGPGVVAVAILSDWYDNNGSGGRISRNLLPLVAECPGRGGFDKEYFTSYRTANGKVQIDYDRKRFKNEGTLHVIVESSDADANLDRTWLIKF